MGADLRWGLYAQVKEAYGADASLALQLKLEVGDRVGLAGDDVAGMLEPRLKVTDPLV